MTKLISCIAFLAMTMGMYAQKIHLNVGDKYNFKSSSYADGHNSQVDDSEKKTYRQALHRHTITLNVLEEKKGQYLVGAQFGFIDNYSHTKKSEQPNWTTQYFGNHECRSEKIKENTHPLFASLNIKPQEIRFQLSKDAVVSQISFTNKEGINEKQDSIFQSQLPTYIQSCFLPVSRSVKKGNEYKINGVDHQVDKVDGNLIYLSAKTETDKGLEWLSSAIVDKERGLILEKTIFHNVFSEREIVVRYGSDGPQMKKVKEETGTTTRQVLIVEREKPYFCQFSKDGPLRDTTLTKTNVRIRGRIINSKGAKEAGLTWNESIPNGYNRYGISIKLDDDDNFDLRLYLDKMTKVDFWHIEKSTFYLQPGDDLFITVDVKQFDESIRATGVGSQSVNYSLDRFLEDEKNKSDFRSIYDQIRKFYKEKEPEEFKQYHKQRFEKILAFHDEYKHRIAPEVYLADYYETLTTLVGVLKDYPRRQEYYRKKDGKEPFVVSPDYYDFDNLVHPDNDLMAFARGYEHFIREYVFFYLNNKFDRISGKGNTIVSKNWMDQLYLERFYMCDLFFSGTTQHVLKYKTVEDAMKRGSWERFEELYNDFKESYPHSDRTKLLATAYEKMIKLAPGTPAFNFELEDLEGNTVKLSDFRNKAVYIDFWSTGCGPCRYAMEQYSNKLHKKMEGKDVEFVFIALEGNVDRVKKYLEDKGIEGTHLIAKSKESLIREKYFFNGIPHYYLIDTNGNIVKREAPGPREMMYRTELFDKAINPQ